MKMSVVPSTPYDLNLKFSSLFYTADAETRFKTNLHRAFTVERKRDLKVFEQIRLVSFFSERKLDRCLDFPKSYSRNLVLEFYANLSQDIALAHSPNFQKVFVRDQVVEFSPSKLNEFLGTPNEDLEEEIIDFNSAVKSITGRKLSKWTSVFSSTHLSRINVFLHQIIRTNWLPSTNASAVTKEHVALLYLLYEGKPFNLGKTIFDSIMRFAESPNSTFSFPHPALITSFLKAEGVTEIPGEIATPISEVFKRPQTMFSNHRFNDLADPVDGTPVVSTVVKPVVVISSRTSGQPSASTSNIPAIQAQIAIFKAQVNTLNAEIHGKQVQVAGLNKAIADLEASLSGSSQKGGDGAGSGCSFWGSRGTL
jgi:hypothetical protein